MKVFENYDISSTFQTQESYRCSQCNSVRQRDWYDEIDLILPICKSVENGGTMQKLLNCYIDSNQNKKYLKCDLSLCHTSRMVFQNLPQVLVMCLGRATNLNTDLDKSSSPITTFMHITLNDSKTKTTHNYVLI